MVADEFQGAFFGVAPAQQHGVIIYRGPQGGMFSVGKEFCIFGTRASMCAFVRHIFMIILYALAGKKIKTD
jgi:hypothetical protein